MKKSKPTKLLLGFLGIATFASLVGTVSGTLAWYSYSTRATLSYSGTSVSNTAQLQIGLASNIQITSYSSDEMTEVTFNGDSLYYYFAPAGSGLTSELIAKYLEGNGHPTNYLCPVTSGSFKRGDSFGLKASPSSANSDASAVAKDRHFITLPFVFRVIRSNTVAANDFVPNQELWITDATVRASSVDDGNIYKSLRMFVDRDNSYEDDFILNPSASDKGQTTVGGLLNIAKDDYYDYNDDGEIIYGEYESIGGLSENGYAGADEIADINETGSNEITTFTAKHRPGVNYYNNYNNCVFKKAEYESLSSVAPLRDMTSGNLYNRDSHHPSSVCKTAGAEGHYLGRVDFTIYLEGWDHSVVDGELEHFFDLGLTFEINKLGA